MSIPVLPSEELRVFHTGNGDLLQATAPGCAPGRLWTVFRERGLTSCRFDLSDRTVNNHRSCHDSRPIIKDFETKPSPKQPGTKNFETKPGPWALTSTNVHSGPRDSNSSTSNTVFAKRTQLTSTNVHSGPRDSNSSTSNTVFAKRTQLTSTNVHSGPRDSNSSTANPVFAKRTQLTSTNVHSGPRDSKTSVAGTSAHQTEQEPASFILPLSSFILYPSSFCEGESENVLP